eukprot:9466904-Pyramimonas_sp.AAC.1
MVSRDNAAVDQLRKSFDSANLGPLLRFVSSGEMSIRFDQDEKACHEGLRSAGRSIGRGKIAAECCAVGIFTLEAHVGAVCVRPRFPSNRVPGMWRLQPCLTHGPLCFLGSRIKMR